MIEWDSLELRVDGKKLSEMARATVAGDPMIERLELHFAGGLLRVEGSVRKFISVPFTIDIPAIEARGTAVRIPLSRISAGPIPIPMLLVRLLRNRLPQDLVHYEEPATLVLALDRFLPPFVSADIQQIRILEGGLAVTLGRGGADLPEGAQNSPGGAHGRERTV